MIFMGQEFLEDKYWSDWQGRPELLIWWEGLEGGTRRFPINIALRGT
jgi:1,4-alpha-glucan branching enzyme